MSLRTWWLIGGLAAAASPVVFAESQAAIASRANADGERLLHAGNARDASAKFRDAAARVPEPRYFFNLCDSTFQEGKLGEALAACGACVKLGQPPLVDQAKAMSVKIRAEAKRQHINVE